MASSEKHETEAEFLQLLGGMSNAAYISQAIGLGSYLGIFEVLTEFNVGKTCEEIAEKGNWKSRYMQEWLSLLVCGNIIDYDEKKKTYFLPKHRHNALTSKGGSNSMTITMQSVHVLTQVQFQLADCFAKDGPEGIPYSSYKGITKLQGDKTRLDFGEWSNLRNVITEIPNLIKRLEEGISVCEPGCGIGHHICMLAEKFPKSTFIGFDIDEEAIEAGKATCVEKNLSNLTLLVMDAAKLPQSWNSSFHVAMVWDVIHDQPQPKKLLRNIHSILKPGGIFFMNDIKMHTDLFDNKSIEYAPSMFGFSLYHCMPISLYHSGEGVGACWGLQMQKEYLLDTGFENISLLEFEGAPPLQAYLISYKPQ